MLPLVLSCLMSVYASWVLFQVEPQVCTGNSCLCLQIRFSVNTRDVTDSESDGIRHFSRNLKSIGYLKSDCNGFKIFVSVQLYQLLL